MPTLFTNAGFRFFFVMFDLLNEPFHIHVGDGFRKLCKYWIFADGSYELSDYQGFKQSELNETEATLTSQMTFIQEAYGNYCTGNHITVNYKPSVTPESVTIRELPVLVHVWVDDTRVHFELEDGRSIAWPMAWSSILAGATPEQRQQFSHSAYHVFWDNIDEIIGVKNVLYPSRNLTNSSD